MSYIVSANYRDRQSPFKWLVRDAKDYPKKAVAYKSVRATGVTFGPSDKYESGFGCSTVATAETVETSGPEKKETRLTFEGRNFYTEGGKEVKAVDVLDLREDGKMFATL